jgi:hypothetical protein
MLLSHWQAMVAILWYVCAHAAQRVITGVGRHLQQHLTLTVAQTLPFSGYVALSPFRQVCIRKLVKIQCRKKLPLVV